MRYATPLLLLLAMPVMAASVWKWRDAQGVVHYSDQPVPGAEQVTIQASSTFEAPRVDNSSTSVSKVAPISYKNIEVWKPGNETTIANSGGVVGVGVRVEPQLSPQHRLALYMDGKLVSGFPERGMEYELANVDRGAHTLVLTVIDAQGNRVATSTSIQFFVQQPSVLRPR